jgi:hypothetical protein
MKVSEAFPSKYIAAPDLNNRNVRVTIARVEIEKVGDDTKPVIYFKGKEKALVCNKTNAKAIAAAYGDEMNDWIGVELILFPIMTDYQGESKPAVRVRAPQPKDNPRPAEPRRQLGGVSDMHIEQQEAGHLDDGPEDFR